MTRVSYKEGSGEKEKIDNRKNAEVLGRICTAVIIYFACVPDTV